MKQIITETKKTVFIIALGFAIVYITTKWSWAIIVSLIIGLVGISSDYFSKRIIFLWTKLSRLLSFIMPNVLLSIVYFLFLFPIARLSRLFGRKDILNLKNTKGSLFINRDKQFGKSSFEKLW